MKTIIRKTNILIFKESLYASHHYILKSHT